MDIIATRLVKQRLIDLMYVNPDFAGIEIKTAIQPFAPNLNLQATDLVSATNPPWSFSASTTFGASIPYIFNPFSGGWTITIAWNLGVFAQFLVADAAPPQTAYGLFVVRISDGKLLASQALPVPVTCQIIPDGFPLGNVLFDIAPDFLK